MKLLAKLIAAIAPSYRVIHQGRAGIRYREGKKEMAIDSEMLFGNFDIVVYLDSIARWLPPHDAVPVTPEDKERIRQNLAESMKSLKVDWQK